MNRSGLVDARDVIETSLREDPVLRDYWERTAPARAVANGLIAYRIAHDLTQTQLALRLGVKQPRIARLETGEHNPTWDTLWLLSNRLGLSFLLSITPLDENKEGRRPIWRSPEIAEFARDAAVEEVSSLQNGTQTYVVAKVEGTRTSGE